MAFRIPICARPLAPPPLSVNPILGRCAYEVVMQKNKARGSHNFISQGYNLSQNTKRRRNKINYKIGLILMVSFLYFQFQNQLIAMARLPRKTIVVSTALIASVLISVAFSAPPERKFKNLKILPKNISEKELDSVMHGFTRGLG